MVMGVSLMKLTSDCKVKPKRRVGLLVLAAAAVTVMMLNVVENRVQKQHIPLSNFYNAPLHRVSQNATPPNATSTQSDENLSVSQSFCDGKNYKKIVSNDDKFSGLKSHDDVAEGRNYRRFFLPTRPRARNQKLYQKDFVQHLSNNWTEKATSRWALVLKARQTNLRKVCRQTNLTSDLGLDSSHESPLSKSLIWVIERRLVWCPVFKAASTTWVKNLLLASGKTVENKGLHSQLRELYPPPATDQGKMRTLRDSMKVIVVRHPFERLLSAYRDKMLRVARKSDSFILEQQKIAHSYWDPGSQPTPYTAAELKKVSSLGRNSPSFVHPTFTQFLKKVRDDVEKIRRNSNANINGHWRPFWVQCDPCFIDYDVIAHVETLMEDQEYVIRKLGLQDQLQLAHTHASRFDTFNNTSEAAETYFKQVPRKLMESLATLFRPDFELFGYSPAKYLALAAAPSP